VPLLLLQWKSAVSDKLKAQQDTLLAANERDQRVFKVGACFGSATCPKNSALHCECVHWHLQADHQFSWVVHH
jgi:hypothetical protein